MIESLMSELGGPMSLPWAVIAVRLVGAVVLLSLEEVLSGFTQHWPIGLGLLLLAIVLFAPRGVAALFGKAGG